MKNKFLLLTLILFILITSIYIFTTFQKMVPTTTPATNPNLKTEPFRIYGLIEPENRAVYINPPITKRVDQIFKVAGDPVQLGEPLVQLDNATEKARLESLKAELEAKKASLAIHFDRVERNRKLIPAQVIDEFEYKQSELDYELSKAEVEVAIKKLEQAQVELDRLLLKSPIDGKVYRMDLLLGDSFNPSDNTFIVGKNSLWVNLRVDSYWINRISEGRYTVFNADTDEKIGTATFIRRGFYMGKPNFFVEDPSVMVDIKYLEAFLDFKPDVPNLPIQLVVYAEKD